MTEYGQDVWNFAYCMTRKWELADDITQEVFLKAYRHMDRFRREASPKTWLLTIARNTVRDHMKSAFMRRVTLVDWVQNRETHPSAEDESFEQMAVSDIWRQVLQLPVKYKEVLILFAHYQLSMKEIARLLGTREGTVKSRLHQARLKVLQIKERDENEQKRI
ncbi:RNA polymerase subunit sigma-70 [Xylanibacillus composti]|nr:RNA polymerase subunit sigma-70 [Xylanibacillus composti]